MIGPPPCCMAPSASNGTALPPVPAAPSSTWRTWSAPRPVPARNGWSCTRLASPPTGSWTCSVDCAGPPSRNRRSCKPLVLTWARCRWRWWGNWPAATSSCAGCNSSCRWPSRTWRCRRKRWISCLPGWMPVAAPSSTGFAPAPSYSAPGQRCPPCAPVSVPQCIASPCSPASRRRR